MSKAIARNQVPVENTWRLEDIFATDAAWEVAYAQARDALAPLGEFEGKLHERDALHELLSRYFDAQRAVEALGSYAAMRLDQDTSCETYQALSDRAQALEVALDAATSYIAPELLALGEGVLLNAAADAKFADYDVFLKELERGRTHTLGAAEERVLALAGELGGAPGNIYEMLTSADMTFPSIEGPDGAPIQITQANYVPTLMNRNRRVRQAAYAAYYETYMRYKNTLPAAYAASVKAAQFSARARGFASTRAEALFADDIPSSVYDGLIDEAHRHLPALNRLLLRNARMIGLERLHMYDIYVPAVSAFSLDLPFEAAYELVVDCLSPLGEDYQQTLRRALSERWIDRYENASKHAGAYAWGTYDTHPYVLLNHHEDLDGLLTIAHEMGHAMHTHHSNMSQPYAKSAYSLFVAEVASTVNEVLVMMELLERYPQRDAQAYLLYHLLNAYRATLFRQTMFAEFERDAHAMAESGEALTADRLCALYERLNRTYYPSVEQGVEASYEWMRIPHFYRAFYVFVYATGFSAATAIAAMIREQGESAAVRYRAFLSTGGSLPPIEALKLAGVDMTSSEPVERALTLFEQLLDRYEQVT